MVKSVESVEIDGRMQRTVAMNLNPGSECIFVWEWVHPTYLEMICTLIYHHLLQQADLNQDLWLLRFTVVSYICILFYIGLKSHTLISISFLVLQYISLPILISNIP